MIGTIRKHSKWLWWIIAGLTVISFLYWGVAPSARNGGIGGNGDFGTLYGHKITQQDYINARNEFFLFYWIRNNEWPDRNPNIKDKELEEQIYLRLMLTKKAETLGIYVTDEAAAAAAGEILRSLGRNGQSVPIEAFVKQVLQPKGLTDDDFERFARDDIVIQQLVQALGLTGALVTPQEAAAAYQREHQEVSAQIVFLSASNYLSQVAVTPEIVAQFYTNYLAQYRLPDRVQVSYVEFNLTNFLAQAKAELAKTNFDDLVEMNYRQLGPDYFPDAKTPDAAKAKIRDLIIRKRAMTEAQRQANDFAVAVFNLNPVVSGTTNNIHYQIIRIPTGEVITNYVSLSAENFLSTVARPRGLAVQTTAPFDTYGPQEFLAPDGFARAALALTPDEPVAGPIAGPTAVYVIALANHLPSEIPSLDQIRDRVTRDFRTVQATMLAQRAGTNFAPALAGQLMAGHSFASACITAGLQPEALPPFSLSTQELPALGNRVELNQFLRIAANVPVGRTSPFIETGDGGFIVYVQSKLPVDETTMTADLPQFTASLRRARASEAFNQWVQAEANRQLRTTPVFNLQSTGAR